MRLKFHILQTTLRARALANWKQQTKLFCTRGSLKLRCWVAEELTKQESLQQCEVQCFDMYRGGSTLMVKVTRYVPYGMMAEIWPLHHMNWIFTAI